VSYLDRLKDRFPENCPTEVLTKLTEAPFVSSVSTRVGQNKASPPLCPASASRRQKALALLARDGGQYAVPVEDPNTDPVVMALATPDGTCDVLIPKDRHEPFAVLVIVKEWEREAAEPDPLWWRVAILVPGGQNVEADTPSGWTLAEWRAYSDG
jgi:hypothetical protein